MVNFLSKREMAQLLGVRPDTLKDYRKAMIEGIHFIRPNSRVVRYNPGLVIHWFANRQNPEIHQSVIDSYLASLPENQPKKRGRKTS
ncbi:MAG: hypothetical protein NW220_17010 [Leptolyngbyaceae cyanobacterium bins.349]|nr:hypothetical protein [Leptolyngbyaceae cyanobacterium bins.349]